MEKDCSEYYKTATATKIWLGRDAKEEDQLYKCLLTKKAGYISSVVIKNWKIHEDVLETFAEAAFSDTCVYFRDKTRDGSLVIKNDTYIRLFYLVFKGKYLKLVEEELKRLKAIKAYNNTENSSSTQGEEEIKEVFLAKMREVLQKMDEGCRQLLTQKYLEGFSYEKMVEIRKELVKQAAENGSDKGKKEITRDSAIKILSRCRGRFLEIWNNLK